MKYDFIQAHCLAKKGVEQDYQPAWQATRYLIRGKMFAMIGGDKEGKEIVTMKLDPMFGALLREQYKDIVPGYYMNKTHWNSLYLHGNVPEEVLREMLDQAYTLVLQSLSKTVQKEIAER